MYKPWIAVTHGAIFCLFTSPALLADTTDAGDPLEIVITASRKAQTADETLAPVTVFTRKDIERYQPGSLPDLLKRVPGLTFINSGGAGKQTAVFLQGANSNHVLVLVDGVKVGSATTGTTAFELLPLEQVERIEVVRGPRSSLYGSEAIGGVIQIFTRRGVMGFQPSASVSLGSHDTQKGNLNLAGGNGQSWYNLNLAHEKTNGFNVLDAYLDYPPPTYAPVVVRESDKDGFKRDSVSLHAGHRFANGASTEISTLHAQGDTEYDGGFSNQADFTQQVISGKVVAPVGKHTVTAQIGQARDNADNFKNSDFRSRFNTRRDTASLQTDLDLASAGKLSIGLDQQKDKVESNTPYDRNSRDNTGLFSNYQQRIGGNNLELSLRQDKNEQFGRKNTGSLALGRDLENGLRVTAAYGTAFKAPTFNDLYYPDSDFYKSNPNLKPESSGTLELGVSGHLPQGQWAVNAHQTQIKDLITYVSDPVTYVGTVENVAKARIQGVEASASTTLSGWKTRASLALQQAESRSGTNAGKLLPYRPRQVATVDVDRRFGQWGVGATLRAEGKRYADTANTAKVGGYGTVDLRADHRLGKNWRVAAQLNNALDKTYELNRGYNQDGINGLVTLTYTPESKGD